MDPNESLYPPGAKAAVVGAAIWLALLISALLNVVRLSIFDLLFLLAPWVVVPLVLGFVPATQSNSFFRACRLTVRFAMLPGAALTTVSFFLKEGRAAGVFVSLWLLVAAALALDALDRLVRTRLRSFQEFCFAFGEAYALVGALWLLASRIGLQPVGFHEPIVLLTAVHFHYAGLMAAILAGLASSSKNTPLSLRIALFCAVVGPGLLGLAFLAGPKLKLVAVGLVVIGEFGIAIGTFRIGWSAPKSIGRHLLMAGSVCVIFGMVLAGVWAVGEYPLHAFVNLEQMARYHGLLNSVGFGLCSLVGWTLMRREQPAALEQA